MAVLGIRQHPLYVIDLEINSRSQSTCVFSPASAPEMTQNLLSSASIFGERNCQKNSYAFIHPLAIIKGFVDDLQMVDAIFGKRIPAIGLDEG